jgi:hypothetical protein
MKGTFEVQRFEDAPAAHLPIDLGAVVPRLSIDRRPFWLRLVSSLRVKLGWDRKKGVSVEASGGTDF